MTFFVIAILKYPGGSELNPQSRGFSWTQNFFSNLFQPIAINGSPNQGIYFAQTGIVFLSISYSCFFLNFAKKVPAGIRPELIKYLGSASMICTLLTVTRLHDLMSALASVLFLSTMILITWFIARTNLILMQFACVITIIVFGFFLSAYGLGRWDLLPALQKIAFLSMIFLTICLEYFTNANHFSALKR